MDSQREHDLVRYLRQELFEEKLITLEEYTALAKEAGGSYRLATYDGVREVIDELEEQIKKLNAKIKVLEEKNNA